MTAKKLFIHRHTAAYRIDLIKEITDLDFATCSNEVLMQIPFSCEYFLQPFKK